MEPYEGLANAIVLQAASDYEYALSILHTKAIPRGYVIEAQRLKGDCDRFFKSDWYSVLTQVDASYITGNIEDMVVNAQQVVYDEQERTFKCLCGKKVNERKLSGSMPIIRCKFCDRRIRVWGVPI